MQRPVRIGAVSYLNTKPLIYGLEHGDAPDGIELSHDVPAVLTERMLADELDVALLPVIALGVLPALELVPGLGITTRGPSLSVLLLSRVPLDAVRSVALDRESNTSNALTRVLFADAWGGRPRFEPGPATVNEALSTHDAVVRIGDKALFEAVPAGVEAHDLGEAWTRATGLPFVFAAWAARPGIVDRALYTALHASKREGRRRLDRIAEEFRYGDRRDPALVLQYLRHHIQYRLGAAELRAMRMFFAAAVRVGAIDREPEIRLALAGRTDCHDAARRSALAGEAKR